MIRTHEWNCTPHVYPKSVQFQVGSYDKPGPCLGGPY